MRNETCDGIENWKGKDIESKVIRQRFSDTIYGINQFSFGKRERAWEEKNVTVT